MALSLRSVRKEYGGQVAVDMITLDIAPGEFMTFLGPSGSGKTTTLNMIAGFVQPSAGEIFMGGREISRVPCHKRGIGMVFQNYALFPHMTVEQNVAYPLKQRKVPANVRRERVSAALGLVQLQGMERRRPAQLSGGQQQRVALARALVYRPPVLLMDEPLGALDKRLRETLQFEIKRIHDELGITFVYVTHDQDEALLLSDRIAVFKDGRIEQVGTAEDLYERPATTFVAEFVGDSNVFHGTLAASGTSVRLDDGRELRVPGCGASSAGRGAAVVLRPERARVLVYGEAAQPSCQRLSGVVASVHYMGSARRIEVEIDPRRRMLVKEPADRPSGVHPGDPVDVCWQAEDCAVILSDEGHGTHREPATRRPVSAT